MGKLIAVVVFVAIVWAGWWAVASTGMQRGISRWLDARRDLGWQADVGSMQKLGFPMRLHTRMNDIAVADPTTGVAVGMDQMDITTPTYWPGYVTVSLPQTPITVASPTLRATVTAADADADLRLRPGRSLQLQSLGLKGGAWSVDTAAGSIAAADGIELEMAQQAADIPVYDMKVNAVDLVPGQLPRSFLRLSDDWPVAFDTFNTDLTVTFDRLWDRRALEARRPQPRVIDIKLAQFIWGEIELRGTGNLTVDEEGLASGTVTVMAENWPAILDMVESAGYLPANMRPQAEQMLNGLAQMNGQTTGLDLTITLEAGRISMGFLPLGRAPRIILR